MEEKKKGKAESGCIALVWNLPTTTARLRDEVFSQILSLGISFLKKEIPFVFLELPQTGTPAHHIPS